jgi:hypothetical protein
MPELRAGNRRQPVDGRAVEPVLHHLPGADRGTAMREEIARIAKGGYFHRIKQNRASTPAREKPRVKIPLTPYARRWKNQRKFRRFH